RQGASSVICCYRHGENDMQGSLKEVKNAREEGVIFKFNLQPTEIIQHGDGTKLSVKFSYTGDEKNGNAAKDQIIDADAVILAFGFRPNPQRWFDGHKVTTHEDGRVKVNSQHQTDNPKVFAAGDMVRGADLVVTAIADARQAGEEIINFIK
ncbi:MAG: FAD-dependent oxidoreductase, partial [Gammaproteobacteria bacterium]|nr:FAD-dependent oxidoreductase [Gammaproteobacteria bacterium]